MTLAWSPAFIHRLDWCASRRLLDMSLPGGQDRYFKEIHTLAAGGGFSGEAVHEISKQHDTNFPGR